MAAVLPGAGGNAATTVPVSASGGLVINCAGLGARKLVDDAAVSPSRGQLTVVRNPGVEEFFQDNVDSPEITCVFPHGDHLVLGGVSQPGSARLEFDPVQERAMLERCARIEPKLENPEIIERRIGLRPQRPRTRVEREPGTSEVVHNYGHGGAGVTVSWGCAAEVLRLVQA